MFRMILFASFAPSIRRFVLSYMKALHIITFILLVVGGLNWGLVAFGYNLVDSILGAGSGLAKLVYILVGLAAVVEIVTHKKNCKCCVASPSSAAM